MMKHRLWRKLSPAGVVLIASISLCGCATTKIKSDVAPGVSARIHRVYFVIDNKTMPEKGRDELESTMATEVVRLLAEHSVRATTRIVPPPEPLALSDPPLLDSASLIAFRPDAVLILQAESVVHTEIAVKNLVYRLHLYLPNEPEPSWGAKIENKNYGSVLQGAKTLGAKTAESIVMQLVADGIIP